MAVDHLAWEEDRCRRLSTVVMEKCAGLLVATVEATCVVDLRLTVVRVLPRA